MCVFAESDLDDFIEAQGEAQGEAQAVQQAASEDDEDEEAGEL